MSDKNNQDPSISKKEAISQLWHQGVVCDWLLDANQLEVKKFIDTCKVKQIAAVLARQTGKSYLCLAMGDELCRNNKNFKVLLVAPSQTQARTIAKQTMREILETCPPDLRPEYKTQENLFRYPNGSELRVYGNNAGKIEAIRGSKAHLVICDEVGFWTDMEYSIKSVLLPTLNTTKGKLVVITTPPKSAGHPFQQFYETAKYRKAAILKTIFDCPRYDKYEIDEFADELGGYDSVEFRREYLSEFLVDISMAVVPEATEELLEQIVMEWKRPPYFDTYVSMDLGFRDLTAVLFAYYDYRMNKVIIEDEMLFNTPEQLRTDYMSKTIFDKEIQLWAEYDQETYEPYKRIADATPFMINDLYLQHGMIVQQTPRDDFQRAVNEMRLMISSGKVVINPKCKTLLFHIQNAVWKNENKKDFDRSPDAGHYDFVAALMYLLRNIDYSKNPYPKGYDLNLSSNSFISPHWKANTSNFREGLEELYTLKSTLKRRK